MKIAASIAGIVFASGLAFAATVQLGILPFFGNKQPINPQPQIQRTTVADSLKQIREQRKAVIDSLTRTLLPQKDSIPMQSIEHYERGTYNRIKINQQRVTTTRPNKLW